VHTIKKASGRVHRVIPFRVHKIKKASGRQSLRGYSQGLPFGEQEKEGLRATKPPGYS
jgi:hypothetical protein